MDPKLFFTTPLSLDVSQNTSHLLRTLLPEDYTIPDIKLLNIFYQSGLPVFKIDDFPAKKGH